MDRREPTRPAQHDGLRRPQPSTSSDGSLAKLGSNLICHGVQLTMTLAVWLVKEVLLRLAGAVELIDAEAEQMNRQMTRRQATSEQFQAGIEQFLGRMCWLAQS